MNAFFDKIAEYTDVVFALSLIGMIAVMIIPMPQSLPRAGGSLPPVPSDIPGGHLPRGGTR